MNTEKKYDVFISYRTDDTRLLAENLDKVIQLKENHWDITYEQKYLNVSYDHANLKGQWPFELAKRIDNSKNIILLVGKKTFNFNEDHFQEKNVQFYNNLASIPLEEYNKQIEQFLREGTKIDFLRIEIARALKNKIRIVPVVIYEDEIYDLQDLKLPNDILAIKWCQGVTYHNHVKSSTRLDDIWPNIKEKMDLMENSIASRINSLQEYTCKLKLNRPCKLYIDNCYHSTIPKDIITQITVSTEGYFGKVVANNNDNVYQDFKIQISKEDIYDIQLETKDLSLPNEIFIVDNFCYTKDKTGLGVELKKVHNINNPNRVIIPPEITYKNFVYKVTAICDTAFENQKELINIQLPEGIKTIGKRAFMGCSALKKINIPKIR